MSDPDDDSARQGDKSERQDSKLSGAKSWDVGAQSKGHPLGLMKEIRVIVVSGR